MSGNVKTDSNKKTVLVVDDETDLLDIVQVWLKDRGFAVLTANNGTDALRQLETVTPDLILLDLLMPNVDGLELLTQIKKNPKTKSIPVNILTVKGDTGSIDEALRRGAKDFLIKPFESDDLYRIVDRTI